LRGTTHHLVVCANVNFLGENINTVKKKQGSLLVASEEVHLGVSAEETEYHIYQKICFS
jgi:hypothetical protein